MDYQTKLTSRKDLRVCAKIFRRLFHVQQNGRFPVLEALEHVPDVFHGSGFVIVEDSKMPAKTMARCFQNDAGGHTMRKNEYTSLEQFCSQYTGVWTPSEGRWLGLDFSWHGIEYRLNTGSMYNPHNTILPDRREALLTSEVLLIF